MRPVAGMRASVALMAVALMGALSLAIAQEQSERSAIVFDIPPQSMADALQAFAKQADLQILFKPESVDELRAPGLSGRMTVQQALDALLKGTGLEHVRNGDVVVVRSPNGGKGASAAFEGSPDETNRLEIAQASGSDGVATAPPVPHPADAEKRAPSSEDTIFLGETLVTGTLIRGARSASPLFTITRDEISLTGYTTLQQVIDGLPQNYGGGDAEGTVLSPGGSSLNVAMGSAVNLRGLGSDATLVLLDGRRLAPAAFGQFVDVSMVPLSAIERIEILADGASATYGSDAVAGVVNIILRDDYDGAETRLQYGSTTERDIDEIQVGQSLGDQWSSGNGLLIYEYYKRGNLDSNDRDYARDAIDPYDLLPKQERHSVLARLAQNLTETTSLEGSALWSQRDALWLQANPVTGEGASAPTQTRQLSAALSAVTEFGDTWQAQLAATYGRNDTHRDLILPTRVMMAERNQLEVTSAELTFDGQAFSVRGEPIQVAVGGAWRAESYDVHRPGRPVRERDVSAAFVEAIVPFDRTLRMTLAARYEHYTDLGDTTNPKVGLVWEPLSNARFRSSWGTSFRAPIFNELDESNRRPVLQDLPDPTAADGTTLTVFLNGNNARLQPEEATTWTGGVDLEFERLFDSTVSMTVFDTEFEDRIVMPLPGTELFTVFAQEDIYDSIITRDPDDAFVAQLAAEPRFLNVFGPFTPADVGAFVDRRLQNLSLTHVRGIDLAVSSNFNTALGAVSVGLNGTYLLDFTDTISETAPENDVLDTAYHPIDLKLRAKLGWNRGSWSGNAFVNYADDYSNSTVTPTVHIDSWTTLDLQLSYTAPWLAGVRFALSASNVFDEDPPFVSSPIATFSVGYDPTNASPLGRFVSLAVTAAW